MRYTKKEIALLARLVQSSVDDIKEYRDLGFEDGESEMESAQERNRWLVEQLYSMQKHNKKEDDKRKLKSKVQIQKEAEARNKLKCYQCGSHERNERCL